MEELSKNTSNTSNTNQTRVAQQNDLTKDSTNNNTELDKDIEHLHINQGDGADCNPVIDINHKLNLMKLSKDQFDEDEKSEDGLLTLNRFNGQPVVIYNMGPEDEYIQSMTSEYSKYCHPYINLVYGYRKDENDNLLIIREHVQGNNFYSVRNYEHLNDRLVAFYKCLTLVEYIHSFKAFMRVIKPEKFILGGGLTCCKLVDLIKNDNKYLINVQSTSKLEIHARFIHPNLLAEDLSDDSLERSVEFDIVKRADLWSLGCMLYYAITKKEPWDRYQTREEILNAFQQNKYFFKDEEIKDDKGNPVEQQLLTWLHKCFDNAWGDDITPFREEMEERPHIKSFISEDGGDLEMDYKKGMYLFIISLYSCS